MTAAELAARRRALKERLRGRERVLAGWTSLAHPGIVDVFARVGFDFIGIDVEHSTYSQEQCRNAISAAQAEGTLCLPRVASHDHGQTKRLLDSGADGVIFPTVSSSERALKLASWCKYPPEGTRGFGVARAQGYGFDFDEYTARWNASSVVIAQIEDADGVSDADGILAEEHVDAVMVGPYDISGSLGVPGRLDHPLVREAGAKVVDACRRAGKACGTQVVDPDAENVERAFDEGFTFVVMASDVFLLWKWAERMSVIARDARRGG